MSTYNNKSGQADLKIKYCNSSLFHQQMIQKGSLVDTIHKIYRSQDNNAQLFSEKQKDHN